MRQSPRGPVDYNPWLAARFSTTYRDFDHMIERLEDDFREWHEQRGATSEWADIDLSVIGWSKRDGIAKAYSICTRAEGEEGFSCILDEITDNCLGPALPDVEYDRNLPSIGVDPSHRDFERNFDPVRHGLPIMEAQRRSLESFEGMAEPISTVGGHAMVTEIDRHGITQRVVHRWPDEAGVPISPDPFVAPRNVVGVRSAPAGLSRQQRRAMEKIRRRA